MRSVLTAVVGAFALLATGPAAAGPSPNAGTPRTATGGPAHSPRAEATRSALESLIARIESTDEGTFTATYRIRTTSGTTTSVTVAQRSPPGRSAFLFGPGEWSYTTVSSTGSYLRWTQSGRSATWCQRLTRRSTWVCGGPLTWVDSNGFEELTAAFVPEFAVDSLKTLLLERPLSTGIYAITTESSMGVPAECLHVTLEAAPYVLCARGRELVSIAGLYVVEYPVWGLLTLSSWSPSAAPSLFSAREGCPARCRHSDGLPGI